MTYESRGAIGTTEGIGEEPLDETTSLDVRRVIAVALSDSGAFAGDAVS